MHLAASPLHEPQESPFDSSPAVQPACHLQTTSVKVGPDSAILFFPTAQTGSYRVQFWFWHFRLARIDKN